jgi:hypothetical protein
MQASIIEYAANQNLGPYGFVTAPESFTDQTPEVRKEFAKQCKTQRIQSSSKVQSFSVLGLVIVVAVTLTLIILSLFLESCVKSSRRKQSTRSHRAVARQLDDKLHLLRMALGKQTSVEKNWEDGRLDVPINHQHEEIQRPHMGLDGLAWYAHEPNTASSRHASTVSAEHGSTHYR